MQELRYNTACIVAVGPFYDSVDGVSIETGLTVSNEKITLIAETDDGNAPTIILDNVAGAASGTDNDLNYISNSDNGMMQLELTAANLNRYGRLKLSITDANNHVPVFHEFEIVSQGYYDWKYGTGGVSLAADQAVNATKIGGTAQTGRDLGASVLVGDKSGFSLSSAGVNSIWDQLLTAIATTGSIGKLIKDYLQAGAAGSSTYADTVEDTEGDPIDGVSVECYSDSDRTTLVHLTETDANGVFTFYLNPATYYFRAIKVGYTFVDWSEVIA